MTDFVTVKFSFQAEALAKSFANTNLTVIHSSPLERALLTAKALQAAQPNFVPLQISPLLREQNFGRGEGQKYDVRKKPHLSFKEHVAQGIYITPFNRSDRYPDGESLDDVAKRADNVVENIILPYVEKATREGNQNMHIAFVSHGIFIAELIASLAAQSGSRPRPSQFRGLRNTGYTRVVVKAVVRKRDFLVERDEGDAQDVHLPVVEVTQHNLCTHLDGLVRQKGGIGRAVYDPGQKDIRSYFKPSSRETSQQEGICELYLTYGTVMSDNSSTPLDDAERIRLKRLAKLQTAEPSERTSPSPAASTSTLPLSQPKPTVVKPTPAPKRSSPTPIVSSPVPARKKAPLKLDLTSWEHESVGFVFNMTLERSVAEQTAYETVWLKHLAMELEAEGLKSETLTADLADRILIARLELNPGAMSDDLEYLPVLASLPAQQTTFEYLVGAWKRVNTIKSALLKKGYSATDTQAALARLEKIRELIISYTGLTLQEPEIRPLGPPELVAPLLSLSALSGPLLAPSSSSPNALTPSDIEPFLKDLAHRFEPDNEIEGVLGPVVKSLLFHESLFRPEGLGGGDASWRGIMGGLELLVSIKPIATMITRMEDWNPKDATAPTFETRALLGPLCRLGVFSREWPALGTSYFSDSEKRSRDDIESSFASLRGTLKSLQSSLFQIFNTIVRTGSEPREAVLQWFAHVIALNSRRAGTHVDPETVASDSFMINVQTILLRFAEPFMDANYSKMDRIDPIFYAQSSRIDLKEETRIKATWVIRQVDPKKTHPNPLAEIPLPEEVPLSFRVLPEYIIEDIVEYFLFVVQTSPDKFEMTGKLELMSFILTFLNCTWYIKNPFLKAKINDVLFMSIWGYGHERHGVLGNLLNTHPVALKHLMPALMHFYIEVEQTGASSQFYDKFNARRNISHVLKVIWDNPTHREALSIEAKNVDKFVRFINLMMNDVTYLMNESFSELTQIHEIQMEMKDQVTWNTRTQEYRREREGTLRSLERQASSYTTLSRSTVELLKVFTAETKAPFMVPEIVDRLAAMLDYNLVALVGPKYQELKVQDPEKLKFDPKTLLSDIIQVFLNLSNQPDFIRAVAGDARSFSRGVFEKAANIALRVNLKSSTEIEQLMAFVGQVEEMKMALEADDEDLGEIPEEFQDPLMATIMRDPVQLPSSKAILDRSTIKSHLLSDPTDPFNRSPLKIEDVMPDLELKARIDAFLIKRRRNKDQRDVDMAEDKP
ncbi:hypothetical protein C0992_012624 [Termitomyces sp. T32_za158]|nr:hypothetical protein C0992_012624 [Termitomyces sp. T32_za158]